MSIPKSFRLALMPLLLSVFSTSVAQDAPLNRVQSLPASLQDQEMRIIEVILAPGEASKPHRHNAYVTVYMLEGEVQMQLRGGEPVTLRPGDIFFESPGDIHQVGRNMSSTSAAKFLVHMLKRVDAPAATPVED